MWDSRAEVETARPIVTTAGAVIAQNAELAHGVALLVAATAGPDGWDAICCSQFAGVPRWTCSHNSGRPTGNIWPLSSSEATSLTSRRFMRARQVYHDAVCVVTSARSAGAGIGSSRRSRKRSNPRAWAEEPFGMPNTRRNGGRRSLACSRSSCGCAGGRWPCGITNRELYHGATVAAP